MAELSSARATAPWPIGAAAKFTSSSGESAETKVSMACTRRGAVPSAAAAPCAPSRPISSRVLNTNTGKRYVASIPVCDGAPETEGDFAIDGVPGTAARIPLEFPSSGPNFWKFDDNVLYEIMVDNTGDAVEDITYQFRFTTVVGNPNTFLYNTGQVTSITDPDLNVRQFFTLTEVRGPRRTGSRNVIGQNLHVMPANVGLISMPNYTGDLGSGVHQLSTDGIRAFAGETRAMPAKGMTTARQIGSIRETKIP